MNSLLKSEQEKKETLSLYDKKLKELKIEFHVETVDTDYGKTNIIISAKSSNPPMILIRGSNGCAPIALETCPTLYTKFRVVPIDVLAQPNKSAETILNMKDNSYGLWINDLINQLQLKNVTIDVSH